MIKPKDKEHKGMGKTTFVIEAHGFGGKDRLGDAVSEALEQAKEMFKKMKGKKKDEK